MSDTEWFDKDLDEFDIPGYTQPQTTNTTDEFEPELDAEDKLILLQLNFEDPSPASSTSKSCKKTTAALQTIKALLDYDGPDVVFAILSRPDGWSSLFRVDGIDKGFVASSLQLIASVCRSTYSATRAHLLDGVLNNVGYWDQVSRAFKKMLDSATRRKFTKERFWSQNFDGDGFKLENLWSRLLEILGQSKAECAAYQKISELLKVLQKSSFLPEMANYPESRTVVSIFPTLTELLEGQTGVDEVTDSTKSPELYLNRHLTMLKEDFFLPIRKELAELRRTQRSHQLRLYPNARIRLANKVQTELSSGTQWNLFTVQLPQPCQSQKEFMNGSLLMFTSELEAFRDLIFAVVGQNDEDTLAKGFVNIEIKHIEGNCNRVLDTRLTMIACEIFFQPYYHVFHTLLSLSGKAFPLKNFLIEGDRSHHHPDYLNDRSNVIYSHKYYKFDVKSTAYPTAVQLKLNSAQLQAFRAGLTEKCCIIQGPCGTGKTFIGLEIASAILANTDKRMLIVCYTNHALDQFLVGLLRHTKSMVRFGSQSKNDILDVFNVKNLEGDKSANHQHYLNGLKRDQRKLLAQFQSMQEDGCVEFQEILSVQEQLVSITQQINELQQMTTCRQILQSQRRVIGMTTTCAARFSSALKAMKIEIVFIEEAAQILESHVVAALSEHTQHLVMIGDHQQLRPINSEHSFKRLYNIDVSLMERLVDSGLHYVRLNVQHRMRPEIANLIRPHIYEDLMDDESVKRMTNVKGMGANVFFIDHRCAENEAVDETTKNNRFEAEYLTLLCQHLRRQGHASEDIVILCTYNGQKTMLMKMASTVPQLNGVKILTVDNFQGEESKIVLLSLVRSNNYNSIGFLGSSNRICVALSRAKEGFYMIGNMDLLARNSILWSKIREVLEQQSAIGSVLNLKCDIHRTDVQIQTLDDFQLLKLDGCNQNCDK